MAAEMLPIEPQIEISFNDDESAKQHKKASEIELSQNIPIEELRDHTLPETQRELGSSVDADLCSANTQQQSLVPAPHVHPVADDLKLIAENETIAQQPKISLPVCPPGLEQLLDCGQMVIHVDNLRFDHKINDGALQRMEVINEVRQHLFTVEQERAPHDATSFSFMVYSKNSIPVAQFYSPSSSTCIRCGLSWHCQKSCSFQTVVYCPMGQIIGFVRRTHTTIIQEFEILDSIENRLLVLRGAAEDFVLYSPSLSDELGRLSVHHWHGIMHEVRRSSDDYGLTFPIDLDTRVKVILLAAVFSTHWLYKNRGT